MSGFLSIDMAQLKMTQAALQRTRKAVIKEGDKGYAQMVYYLFNAALKVSPQFSGDFVYNWNLVVNGDLGSYRRYSGKGEGDGSRSFMRDNGTTGYQAARHQAGDEEAMASPRARMVARLKNLKVTDRVQFVNMSGLDTDNSGTKMVSPNDTVNLRVENIIPGGVRIASYLKAQAKNPSSLIKAYA